jgi:tRNA (mo5U34)-methyltransferase
MEIGELTSHLQVHVDRLREARAKVGEGVAWYPYDSLSNFYHLDTLLRGDLRDLDRLAMRRPVADIGAADGDVAFALEAAGGWDVDIIDTASTNMNGLEGARKLARQLDSRVQIYDIDLDQQFRLPRDTYGLVLLLGILYHLQNPFYVLKELARRAEYCLVSTRVARFAGHPKTAIGALPVAYLVDAFETNNDPTNHWIFSPAGFERLASRTGWVVLETLHVGNVAGSDPATAEGDERMFALLRSN